MITMGRHVTAAAPGGGAMASDTNALYWSNPDDLAGGLGTTVTSWPDASGNGQGLSQLGAVAMPTKAAVGTTHDGTQALANSTTGTTGRVTGELLAGREAAFFVVFTLDASGQAANQNINYHLGVETASNSGSNQMFYVRARQTSFIDPPQTNFEVKLQKSLTAISLYWESLSNRSGVKMMLEFWSNQTTSEMLIDGVVVQTGTPTVAQWPDGAVRLAHGGNLSASALGDAFIGTIHERFATADASPANRAAIRAELQAKHGL